MTQHQNFEKNIIAIYEPFFYWNFTNFLIKFIWNLSNFFQLPKILILGFQRATKI
jgi:hypothetical protein